MDDVPRNDDAPGNPALGELVQELRQIEAAMAAWLDKVATYDRSGQWRADGYLNARAALRDACNMNPGVARGLVDLARKLREMPGVAAAFRSGRISRQHAQVIANAFTPERAAMLSTIEGEIADAAHRLTPRELHGFVRHFTDAIDGDGGAAADERAFARRRFHMSITLGGMVAEDGLCDRESGEIHLAAINAEMDRDLVPGDTRTSAQRRFDALTNILRRSLENGELGEQHGVRPHLLVAADVRELPGSTPDLVELARRERRHDGTVSQATIERLLCDCTFSRVLMEGPSEVLDVGRATRTVTTAQWKALVMSDRHCVVPGCKRPPAYCVAHHLDYWEHGGPTDLDNLVMMCHQHHRQLHEDDVRARAGTSCLPWRAWLEELRERRRGGHDPPQHAA